MPVYYKITPVTNKLTTDGEPCYSITIVGRTKVEFEKILDSITEGTTFTAGDVMGVIESLTYEIARILKSGGTVSVDGLGTFYISAETKKKITNPARFDSRNVKLKRISFKADSRFKKKFNDISFTKTLPKNLQK